MTLTGTPLDPRHRWTRRPHAEPASKRGIPTISAIPNILAKPGLPWGAAKETAKFAVYHRPEWEHLTNDDAVATLYKHHAGIWAGRAAMGTLIHECNERWSWGETIEVEELIALVMEGKRPPKLWRGFEDAVAQDALGYLDGLEKFWHDWSPATVSTEEVVRHEGSVAYVGQRDWVADMCGHRWLIEIKTTAKQEEAKAIYPDSWRLQLAGQRFAEQIVLYDGDGKESGSVPNFPVHRCGVLHLRGDGNYTLFELEVGPNEWLRFLQGVGLWTWVNRESRQPPPFVIAPGQLKVVR